MKRFLLLPGTILFSMFLYGQNNVNFSASDNWIAYMNVYETPANGGAWAFGSPWGVSDLAATLDPTQNTLTVMPNYGTYAQNATDPYWVDQTTGDGNKIMEASTYVEPGASFEGQDLTFSGQVLSNTLDNAYEAKYFIKALDATNNYSDALIGAKVFDLPASGEFTVTAMGSSLTTGLIIQYGFVVVGVNANPADSIALGNVVISSSSLSLGNEKLNKRSFVFPNPAKELISINSKAKIDMYRILDAQGVELQQGTNLQEINISDFAKGLYYVELIGIKNEKIKFVKI